MANQELKSKATNYIDKFNSMFKDGLDITIELLKELGATKDNPIVFDWKENYAPAITTCEFGDDITDAFVTKIYLNGNSGVYVDLYAYYLCDNRENVCLNHEYQTEWIDIIEYLIGEVENR